MGRRPPIFKSIVLALAGAIGACTTGERPAGDDDFSSYEPLQGVPADFLSAHPPGSQTRKLKKLQRTFEESQWRFLGLYHVALKENPDLHGKVDLVLALNPSGTVNAVGLIGSTMGNAELERSIMLTAGRLNFGEASGDGLYVFHYPLEFKLDRPPENDPSNGTPKPSADSPSDVK